MKSHVGDSLANPAPPRVVIAHDYVTQRGGAERVTLELLRAFPGSRLLTSFINPATTFPEFGAYDVETLWPNRYRYLRADPRRAFPVLASAFENHTVSDADIVICSTSGWAHRVRATAPKIVYCHNPARWLYQPHDYLKNVPPGLRRQFVNATHGVRRSDAAAAHDAAAYIVNSTTVAARVRDAYGLEAEVIPPAVGLDATGPMDPIRGIEPGYLLTISRPRTYKHAERVCEAVTAYTEERLVVVGGGHPADWPLGVTFVNDLSDPQLRWLYANAKALVAVAHEDFGLTPIEAQAFGVPSVVLRSGGYLDSTIEDVTGVFVDGISPAAIAAGIRRLGEHDWDAESIKLCGARFSRDVFARRMHRAVEGVLYPHADLPPADICPIPVRDEPATPAEQDDEEDPGMTA